MNNILEIQSNANDCFDWQIILPDNKFQQMSTYSLSGNWGDMTFQNGIFPEFEIWLSEYNFKQPRKFKVRADIPLVEFSFQIRDSMVNQLRPFSQALVEQAQFNIFFVPNIESFTQFDAGANLITLDVHCTLNFLSGLAAIFPETINPFINEINAGRSVQLFSKHLHASQAMLNIAVELIALLKRDKMPIGRITSKVKMLIFQAIACSNKKHVQGHLITIEELSKINWISRFILTDLINPPNLTTLAKKVAINPTSFKKFFKAIIGTAPYEYWLIYKMQYIQDLLIHSQESITEIAINMGYSALPNFTKAFSKKFDESPSEFRDHYLG